MAKKMFEANQVITTDMMNSLIQNGQVNGAEKNDAQNASNYYIPTSSGDLGDILQSNGKNAPVWQKNIIFSAPGTSEANAGSGWRGIGGAISSNDDWIIRGYNRKGTNEGALEIATGDDGNEPIFVRQYGAEGSAITCHSASPNLAGSDDVWAGVKNGVRQAVLLDPWGNTSFPGVVYSSIQIPRLYGFDGPTEKATYSIVDNFSNFKFLLFAARDNNDNNPDYAVSFIPSHLFIKFFNTAHSTLSVSREGARLRLYYSSNTSFTITDNHWTNRLNIWGIN